MSVDSNVEIHVIHSKQFVQALVDAGIVTAGERVRKLIIVAEVDQPVKLYVERFGDSRLLDLALKVELDVGETHQVHGHCDRCKAQVPIEATVCPYCGHGER